LCIDEPTTELLHALEEGDSGLVVWWLTRIEAHSALARAARERRLLGAGEQASQACFVRLFDRVTEVGPVEAVRTRAEQLVAVHPLRAADALQLAAALVWARGKAVGLEFVSLDQRLRRAARGEGFVVLPATL